MSDRGPGRIYPIIVPYTLLHNKTRNWHQTYVTKTIEKYFKGNFRDPTAVGGTISNPVGSSITVYGLINSTQPLSNASNSTASYLTWECSVDGIKSPPTPTSISTYTQPLLPTPAGTLTSADLRSLLFPFCTIKGLDSNQRHTLNFGVTHNPSVSPNANSDPEPILQLHHLEYLPNPNTRIMRQTVKVASSDPLIEYSPGWEYGFGGVPAHSTAINGSTMSIKFFGRELSWMTTILPQFEPNTRIASAPGHFSIEIDNNPPLTIQIPSSSSTNQSQPNHTLFTIADDVALSNDHILKVTFLTSESNSNSPSPSSSESPRLFLDHLIIQDTIIPRSRLTNGVAPGSTTETKKALGISIGSALGDGE
ncbi:hypothetical protein CVT24_001537 [Panaeolus cyanescens]|uniref:Uncharacterized protein n=1 Tax=Panaeolus cyanescens TaxID=181874 RepID=A0A409YYT6_9AGAR|nr:hypothetical protein CVT24_001537 [Panaeolus cyanescens]